MKGLLQLLMCTFIVNIAVAQEIQLFDANTKLAITGVSMHTNNKQPDKFFDSNTIKLEGGLYVDGFVIEADGYRDITVMDFSKDTIIYMYQDMLLLDNVVVTDYLNKSEKFIGLSSSQISDPVSHQHAGSAAALSTTAGIFVDASLGEVFSRVYSRGVSASAEDDIGWFYTSLQEDGLPITAVQYNYFTPDLYHRTDLLNAEIELIKGGKSAILSQNAPGGIVNFTDKRLSSLANGKIKSTLGLEGDNRLYSRVDGMYQLPLGDNSWKAGVSGFYRKSDGPRDVDYSWNQGGQLRLVTQKSFSKGILRLSYKYLNDHVNRYTGVSAMDWQNPVGAFGQNLNTTALMLPMVSGTLPGGPDFNPSDNSGSYAYDSSNGIHTKEQAIRLDFDYKLGDWNLRVDSKYSNKNANWQTSFSNARVGLEDFIAYFISGGDSPFGNVTFKDAITKEVLAVVDNSGSLGPFSGQPASFNYISGSLPNDAIMGIAPWYKDDNLSELIVQSVLQREWDRHQLSVGFFVSRSDLDYFTNASFAYSTFEANSRLLDVSVMDFAGNELSLSDSNGLSNYGGLFFENGNITTNQYAIFINDQLQINDQFTLDIGARLEHIIHDGALMIPGSFTGESTDVDGDLSTVYDASTIVPSGEAIAFNHNYTNISWSAGLQYDLDKHSLFTRLSSANKSPELNYYINNFSGEGDIAQGESQTIRQAELGWQYADDGVAVSSTVFYSALDNIAQSGFVLDQATQQLFYNPVQLNKTSTYGLELSWALELSSSFALKANHTIQKSNADNYTIYEANGTADISDDQIIDFSDNTLPHTPQIMTNASLIYQYSKLHTAINISYMGARYGNVENSFELPSYTTVGANVDYELFNNFKISATIQNAFNSKGLANFFGPNSFGASANDATQNFIADNPNGDFVVFPIMPRSIYISLQYEF